MSLWKSRENLDSSRGGKSPFSPLFPHFPVRNPSTGPWLSGALGWMEDSGFRRRIPGRAAPPRGLGWLLSCSFSCIKSNIFLSIPTSPKAAFGLGCIKFPPFQVAEIWEFPPWSCRNCSPRVRKEGLGCPETQMHQRCFPKLLPASSESSPPSPSPRNNLPSVLHPHWICGIFCREPSCLGTEGTP